MRAEVVHKIPKLEVLRRTDSEQVDLLRHRDRPAWERLHDAAERHDASVRAVMEALARAGIPSTCVGRDAFRGPRADTDLVIAVGGDGTVLDVSHHLRTTPMLGVNSDPATSVGYFCACSSQEFEVTLEHLVLGVISRMRLCRIAIQHNGTAFEYPCLNDILLTSANPAMMSRYTLAAGSRSEQQASSGIWISTPAGSTAGIRSAGGSVLPLEGDLIQYLVREPYVGKLVRYELLRGVRHLHEGLEVQSLMQNGQVFIDGPYITFPFRLGDTLTLREGVPLTILGMDPALRER
ncbi:MAG: hypothetical protein EA398_06105 [Deltaproteobacteria bacterium]|nr:MAG: hypothetical protein EA398_06105 [Deltaproteobacteria bacterium]